MINPRYRLVFNRLRSLWMAVAKTATGQCKSANPGSNLPMEGLTARLRICAIPLAVVISLCYLTLSAALAGTIVADAGASVGQRPTVAITALSSTKSMLPPILPPPP